MTEISGGRSPDEENCNFKTQFACGAESQGGWHLYENTLLSVFVLCMLGAGASEEPMLSSLVDITTGYLGNPL